MADVAIVGAPFDDAVSHRPGARFGPRAIREAQYTSGSIHSLQLGVEPFEVLTVARGNQPIGRRQRQPELVVGRAYDRTQVGGHQVTCHL